MKLATLLKEAETASPMARIEWRDRIAEHGTKAIDAVGPWLEDRVMAAFAIRVIERAGTNGHLALATQVLRSARSRVPERERGDIDWALQRLRLKAQAEVEAARPSEPGPVARARPVTLERAYLSAVARRRAR
jgi:hypothetical protein